MQRNSVIHAAVRHGRVALLAAAGLAIAPGALRADPMSDYDIKRQMISALSDMSMFDYANLQLDEARAQYPKSADELMIAEAELRIAEKKPADAAAALAKVNNKSPYYARALLTRAKLTKESPAKQALYAEYFKLVPKPDAKSAPDYQDAVIRAATDYADANDVTNAIKRLDLLDNLPKGADGSDRAIDFRKAQLYLTMADNMADEKKPLASYKPVIDKATKILDPLVFQMDYLAALSMVELAHAKILTGQPDAAISDLNTAAEFLRQVETAVLEQIGRSASPLAGGYYYIANAYRSKAVIAKGKIAGAKDDAAKEAARDEYKDFAGKAVGFYYLVGSKYGNSMYGQKAILGVGEMQALYKAEFGEEIKLGKGQQRATKIKLADDKLSEQTPAAFHEAELIYMELVKDDPFASDVPEILYKANFCQLKTGNLMTAVTVADYLASQFPSDPKTPETLYNTGSMLLALSKETTNPLIKDAHQAFANLAFLRFVEVAPDDYRAPKVGYSVAESLYSEAMAASKEKVTADEDGKPDIAAAKDHEMRAKFRDAIPVYEALTRSHGSSPQGIQSYYKLGWVYMFLEKHAEAAANFLLFTKAPQDPNETTITAKYYAASELFRTGAFEDAATQYSELVAMTADSSVVKLTQRILELRANADAQIPWCKEGRASQARAKVGDLQDDINDLSEKIKSGDAQKEYEEVKAQGGEQEVQIQTPEKRLENMKTALVAFEAQVKEMENQALDGFLQYVKEHPNDDRRTPNVMNKIGDIYLRRGNFDECAKWLNKLKNEFPQTEQGQQAAFSLFHSLVEIDRLDDARKLSADLTRQLPEFATANVNFIAKSLLVDATEKEPAKVLDAAFSVAANQELINRGKDAKRADIKSVNTLRYVAFYRIALSWYLGKNYQNAIDAVDAAIKDNPRTPMRYKLVIIKAEALAKMNKPKDGFDVLSESLASMNRTAFADDYLATVDATVRLLVLMDDKTSVGRAVGLALSALDSYDPETQPESQLYVESMYNQLARSYALLGFSDKAVATKDEYLLKYPRGRFRKEIIILPPKKF